MNVLKAGLDVGSTTAKFAVIDEGGILVFSRYERHNADIPNIVSQFVRELKAELGDREISLAFTGSAGMGAAEKYSFPFRQEVMATADFVRAKYPDISTVIDIGGEDAKILYLNSGGVPDLRMNGNCAGGTGAFIDQMAALMGCSIGELNDMAFAAKQLHPIASRCGVFSKTDIQNLISRNARREDVAASIFHAVSVQTVLTLSRGYSILPKILLCGGPLTFIPALRKAFAQYLNLEESDFVLPEKANIVAAWGTAISSIGKTVRLGELEAMLNSGGGSVEMKSNRLAPIFANAKELDAWRKDKESVAVKKISPAECSGEVYIGIDSGSTTTKVVAIDGDASLLYSYYAPNLGRPIETARAGLEEFGRICAESGADIRIKGACSTGYGEDLIKKTFSFSDSIVETMAHYVSARHISPDLSFVLDIGGQDMKAMFVENGVLSQLEINEACSSGCGSFIETFAKSLGFGAAEFAQMAATAQSPCDLGTRCTVFMNSKVKQFLKEGAAPGDIAAGLSYSVVKNCLFKVLKLKDMKRLGSRVVVQGGAMRNDSLVRAFELLTGLDVKRSNMPELMGAFGCALHARNSKGFETPKPIAEFLAPNAYTAKETQCRGCENACRVNVFTFESGDRYFSGNKCEKFFSNSGVKAERGENIFEEKYGMLFDRAAEKKEAPRKVKIGIPRSLNMYEEFPFWHAMFAECGFEVVLSAPSTMRQYEHGACTVTADNICFPAKLVNGHVRDLLERGADRIFMPHVLFEKQSDKNLENSYNCPIVTGYADVVKSAMDVGVPVDSPVVSFKEKRLARKSCVAYLESLGVERALAKKAVKGAEAAQEEYEAKIKSLAEEIYARAECDGKPVILMAGHPYHADLLIQHNMSRVISDFGINVISTDIVRNDESVSLADAHTVSQWAYINLILKSAKWVAQQGENVQMVELTSFGCGPDAFVLDELKNILRRAGKTLTVIKVDDVNNVGSMKLRVRSLVESLRLRGAAKLSTEEFVTTKPYTKDDIRRKIVAPHFTDYISPLLPAMFKYLGYELECLPHSDQETIDLGLKYANNEICYPATLVIGDIIKALESGKYKRDEIAVAITQTGGQCRASNYIALIKNAMVEAGYADVPVLSFAGVSGLKNSQSGFKVNWAKALPLILDGVLYSDCMMKFYYAAAARETRQGAASELREKYLALGAKALERGGKKPLRKLLAGAAEEFNKICDDAKVPPLKVGIVGEIYLKYNSFAHKEVVKWLVDRGVEIMPSPLINFFTCFFVNYKYNKRMNLKTHRFPEFLMGIFYKWTYSRIGEFNRIASAFRHYVPFADIFEEAESAEKIVSLSAQFGEGWLLPADIASFAHQGADSVLSLQPFGCIANQIIAKGVEKKIKTLYPNINLLSLDFDGGVSEVNIINRIHLLLGNTGKAAQ